MIINIKQFQIKTLLNEKKNDDVNKINIKNHFIK